MPEQQPVPQAQPAPQPSQPDVQSNQQSSQGGFPDLGDPFADDGKSLDISDDDLPF